MDNRVIDIQSEGREAFELSMRLHFDNAAGGKATHWVEHDGDLVLLWNKEKDANEVPFAPMNVEEATDFAWRWLETRTKKQLKEYLDHDGSNGRGFHAKCGPWGKDTEYQYGFVRISAIWAWYGK